LNGIFSGKILRVGAASDKAIPLTVQGQRGDCFIARSAEVTRVEKSLTIVAEFRHETISEAKRRSSGVIELKRIVGAWKINRSGISGDDDITFRRKDDGVCCVVPGTAKIS